MIHFRKICDYPRTPTKGDVFEYLCALTKHKIDPPTLHPRELGITDKVVFASPLKRSRECLLVRPDTPVFYPDQLKEIPFDLATLCTHKEWEEQKSTIVRTRFVDAFVADRLLTPQAMIIHEIRDVLDRLHAQPQISATVVSHSFRLKVIEAYIKTQGALAAQPDLLRTFIRADTPTYAFGKGFDVSTHFALPCHSRVGVSVSNTDIGNLYNNSGSPIESGMTK